MKKRRHLWAPRVIRCTGVSGGQLGLDLLTFLFFTRLSQKRQTSLTPSSPPPTTAPLSPPVAPRPLSECHLANKTPVHMEPEQKKKKILPSSHSHCGCQALPRPQRGGERGKRKKTRGLSALFHTISEGRELLTSDQRGYHGKHGRRPNRGTQPLCVCV